MLIIGSGFPYVPGQEDMATISALHIESMLQLRDSVHARRPYLKIFTLGENVASMNDEARDRVSRSFGGSPVATGLSDFGDTLRPRYYWREWNLYEVDEVSLKRERRRKDPNEDAS